MTETSTAILEIVKMEANPESPSGSGSVVLTLEGKFTIPDLHMHRDTIKACGATIGSKVKVVLTFD